MYLHLMRFLFFNQQLRKMVPGWTRRIGDLSFHLVTRDWFKLISCDQHVVSSHSPCQISRHLLMKMVGWEREVHSYIIYCNWKNTDSFIFVSMKAFKARQAPVMSITELLQNRSICIYFINKLRTKSRSSLFIPKCCL